jgi:chromate transporter
MLVLPSSLAQVGVIALGALVGSWLYRHTPAPPPTAPVRGHAAAVLALVLFGVLLVVPRVLFEATGQRGFAFFDAFYRPGALVFGGGHVVLPLLRETLVPRGWLTDDAFLAGYGAAQAVPGPLFSFAAYLGTVIEGDWRGGLAALLCIFLPCWLIIGGTLPFWHRLRAKRWMQAALLGANASVVGVLLAALYSPVITEGIQSTRDVPVVLVAYALLEVWKVPAWAVVALAAGTGAALA